MCLNLSTYRIRKDKENPYVMVNKSFIYDERMSAKAKGILLYLLSRPDDWKVYETEIIKNFSDGRDSIRSGIKELIKFGYIKRQQNRDKNGKLNGYEYEVYEVSTVDGKSNNGKTDNGKSDTTNNDLTNNDINNYKNDNGALNKCTSYDFEIVKAINIYMKDYYKQKTGKVHPYLKPDQYKTVYDTIYNFVSEWGTDYEGLLGMMVGFLNSNIKSDWNINHFATDGILTNRMYETAY